MALDQRNKRILYGAGGVVGLSVILVIILASFGVFSKSNSSPSDPVILRCQSDACQVQSERLNSYTKLDADPCEEFDQFTCGKFVSKKQELYNSIETDEKRLLRDKVTEKLDELLRQENETDGKSIKYIKRAYQECTREKHDEYMNLREIRENLAEQGHSNEYRVAALTALGLSTIVGVDVKPDPFDSSVNILWLTPPKFGMHPKIYQRMEEKGENDTNALRIKELYFNMMNSKIEILLNETGHDYNEDTTNATKLESKLALLSLEESKKFKLNESLVKTTIGELQEIIGDQKFHIESFLNELQKQVGSEGTVNKDTQIIVENMNYFKNFANELVKEENSGEILLNYLTIRLMHDWHYLAYSDFAALDGLDLLNQLEDANLTSRCINAIKQNAPMVLGHVYLANVSNNLSDWTLGNASELASHINLVFQQVINNTDWIANETDKSVLKEKLQKVKLQVGFPKWLLNSEKADNTSKLDEPEEGANATTLITGLYKSAFKLKLNSVGKGIDESTSWQVSPVEVDVSYNHATNTLSVPMAILQTPFFDRNVTGYLNYAGLGVEVAKNLLKAVGWNGVDFNSNGNMISPFSDEFLTNHTKKVECYVNVYNNISYPEFNITVDAERTIDENIADNEALKLAHLAFKNSTSESNLKLPSKSFDKFTDDQLFFISYGSSRCHYLLPKVLYQQIAAAKVAPLTDRTFVSLNNYRNFTDSLSCQKESKYVPDAEKSCSIWF